MGPDIARDEMLEPINEFEGDMSCYTATCIVQK